MKWSASSLSRSCAYPKVLSRLRTPTPEQRRSMDKGTRFHACIESWIRTGRLPDMADDNELALWVDAFLSQWSPPPWVKVEIAWGLLPSGAYVDVVEPEPHKYQAADGSELMTAGRADLVYWEGGLPDGVLCVVDHKSGRWPTEPAATNLQVHAAGYALAQKYKAPAYQPGIYYARAPQGYYFDWGDVVVMGSDEAAKALEDIKHAANLPEAPIVGPQCGPCWERRRKVCKEGMAWKP